jgi:hypothetical protein
MPRGIRLPNLRRRDDEPDTAESSEAVAARLHRIMERPADRLPDRPSLDEAEPPRDKPTMSDRG